MALAVMVFAAGYQVVARYIFHAPPVWTEDLARRSMVWAGMLVAIVPIGILAASVPIAFVLIVVHAAAQFSMRLAGLEKPGPSMQEDALL